MNRKNRHGQRKGHSPKKSLAMPTPENNSWYGVNIYCKRLPATGQRTNAKEAVFCTPNTLI